MKDDTVKDDTVIVRGMTQEWFDKHFREMVVYFGDAPVAVPKEDANFVGFYLEAPVSAITHIGFVESITRNDEEIAFFLKAIVKLDEPVKPPHQIRGHQFWTLKDLGIDQIELTFNNFFRSWRNTS